jgi:ethanolamine ammonia-lyase small subunit
MVDKSIIAAAVRQVLQEMVAQSNTRTACAPRAEPLSTVTGPCRPRDAKRTPPFDITELLAVKQATPARLAQGRTGSRYLTHVSISLRAEHAIALDAVHSIVPEGFARKLGCVELHSRCKDHGEYLLYPDHGRRLDDASRAILQKEGTPHPDIQIIAADGLSAWAIIENGTDLVPALYQGLEHAGFKMGRPLFVSRARVGIQDEIGCILDAKATAILVGERPGLGTGDSLSIYTAFAPKLNQDNAEKDCISNIRPLGLPTLEAAAECVELFKRTFAAGGGGVHLTRSGK